MWIASQSVGRIAVPGPEVHGEMLVTRELRAADTAQQVKRAVHGEAATEIHLAWKQVVPQRQAVIRESPLSVRKQLHVAAQGLVAGLAGLGPADIGLEEEVFCDVVRGANAIDIAGAEVLDGQRAEIGADLDVLGVDGRDLDLAPLHFRLDDAGRRAGRLVGLDRNGFLGRGLVLRPGPVQRRAAREGQQQRRQKKNASPSFHSSISSFSLRLVNT